jgi:hypothetical protein
MKRLVFFVIPFFFFWAFQCVMSKFITYHQPEYWILLVLMGVYGLTQYVDGLTRNK